MQVLIVKLSSLGDVVHTMPVVHDIRQVYADAQVDWVVEPAFAPVLQRVQGVNDIIECAQRRWRKGWWTAAVRAEWRAFRGRLGAKRYDAVIDMQGLTKSVLVARLARGPSFGMANRTEGSAFEWPARWLVDQALTLETRIHALDRAREIAARALNYRVHGSPCFGLVGRTPRLQQPTVVFVHGTSRADKLWPETHWVALGQRLAAQGIEIALPHAGAEELARAQRIAGAIGPSAQVWPQMPLDALVDAMGATHGVVGVDSGLSHIAVALDLPHVQIYNFPTAWRTGPRRSHGHLHQVAVDAETTPSLEQVWEAWDAVRRAWH